MSRTWVRACVIVTTAFLGGCLDPFAPPLGTARIEPPGLYGEYWSAVEQCSGLRGEFGRIRWYAVPTAPFTCPTATGFCYGFWRKPHDIFVERTAPFLVVGHEMLHDLLQRGDHPPVFRACGLIRDTTAGG